MTGWLINDNFGPVWGGIGAFPGVGSIRPTSQNT
jgi:hypothetical protein